MTQTENTSSIPTLPSVVRDSRFRENISKQNSFGIRKRLYQKDLGLDQIYQEIEEDQDYELSAKGSVEIPYFARNNQGKSNNSGYYGRYNFGQIKKSHQLGTMIKKKRFQSAHVANVSGITNLKQNISNKASAKDLYNQDQRREPFFAKRKFNQDAHDSKLMDIMNKIEEKKLDINKIENKYGMHDQLSYGSGSNNSQNHTLSKFGVPKSSYVSPNTSKYSIKKAPAATQYQSRNEQNPNSIIKVTPPPAPRHTRGKFPHSIPIHFYI